MNLHGGVNSPVQTKGGHTGTTLPLGSKEKDENLNQDHPPKDQLSHAKRKKPNWGDRGLKFPKKRKESAKGKENSHNRRPPKQTV